MTEIKTLTDRSIEHKATMSLTLCVRSIIAISIHTAKGGTHCAESIAVTKARSVGEVDTIIVVTAQVNEPSTLVIAKDSTVDT